MPANVDGFLMYGYLKNGQPGLSPNKDTKDEDRLCRSSVIRQPGLKMNSDMKPGFPFVSPYIRKPNVVGRRSSLTGKLNWKNIFCHTLLNNNDVI